MANLNDGRLNLPEDPSIVQMARETRDSNLGSPSFTNVPGAPGTFISPSSPSSSPNSVTDPESLFTGIQSQMDLISKEGDPLKKQAALSNLNASIAETASTLEKQTRLLAESQTGLPKLQESLKRAEQLDRSDPLWSQHLVDSRETMTIRNQVTRAQNESLTLSKRLISENPTISGMNARINGFMQSQQGLINQGLNRADKRDEMLDSIALSITPDSISAATTLFPDVANDPKKAAAVALDAQKGKNKELTQLFNSDFTEDKIMPMATLGNTYAQRLAAVKQKEKTGIDSIRATKEVSDATNFVKNEAFFLDEMKKMSVGDISFKNALSEYTKSGLLDKSKAGNDQRTLQRATLVDTWLSKAVTMRTLNNVDSWIGDYSLKSNPEVSSILDSIKVLQPGKPVSLDTLISYGVRNLPKEQEEAFINHISAAAKSSAEKQNKGLYGHVDLIGLDREIKAYRGKSNFSMGGLMDQYGEIAGKYLNTNDTLLTGTSFGGVK